MARLARRTHVAAGLATAHLPAAGREPDILTIQRNLEPRAGSEAAGRYFFLENLSKRYTLAVLSNTDPIHVAELEKKFDFFAFSAAHLFLRGGREQTFAR